MQTPTESRLPALTDLDAEFVEIDCVDCERRGRYRRSALIARYGEDMTFWRLRQILAHDCAAMRRNPTKCYARFHQLLYLGNRTPNLDTWKESSR